MSDRRKKVISVLSLGHSGSTVISAFLARHPEVITLGELRGSLGLAQRGGVEKTPEMVCSCGVLVGQCPVWTEYIDSAGSALSDMSFCDRYLHLLNIKSLSHYGAIVDTSKALEEWEELRKLSNEGHFDMYTVFVIKDVRSYVVSMRRNQIRDGKKPSPYLAICLAWYRQNKKIKKLLQQSNVPYVQLSYETFCTNPNITASSIYNLVGVNTEISDSKSKHHITRGSYIRKNKELLTTVSYDDAWKTDKRAYLACLLLPFVYFWNQKNVYLDN